MDTSRRVREVYERGEGVLRMVPNFVPRRFSQAGRRLRLHPDDYYALGAARGSIKERWFSSIVPAINGPLAAPDEGLSYVAASDRPADKILFKDAVEELGSELIGSELQERHGAWPMFAKFFDFQLPLFHHLHLDDAAAARVGRKGKPEAYYFPPQLNNHLGTFPVTYLGFSPEVTKEQVRERLAMFEGGDNRITELSRAYRIQLGTGWYTPPGVVHAPGSVLTYEPQWNSDVNSVQENIASGEVYPYEFLAEHAPEGRRRDLDYLMGLMDWEKNVDPLYRERYFRPPIDCAAGEGWSDRWIVYGNEFFSAKELTVGPGRSATLRDPAAYGCVVVQGFGRFGPWPTEAAGMLRFGQLSGDEFFVGEPAARRGLLVENASRYEPLVLLRHFGPGHPDAPAGPEPKGVMP